ncbi:hypothetical protein DPMN_005669 [Dreissena polymorpha]|uniref:Uncharacterized protein n=1 Tax=Dreissena polymorpha TaxID=45954 RepID=A0A9D4MV46_DREPO|nr:hypothetical protein DPMN_005669 [Dreissena polymorpha]
MVYGCCGLIGQLVTPPVVEAAETVPGSASSQLINMETTVLETQQRLRHVAPTYVQVSKLLFINT